MTAVTDAQRPRVRSQEVRPLHASAPRRHPWSSTEEFAVPTKSQRAGLPVAASILSAGVVAATALPAGAQAPTASASSSPASGPRTVPTERGVRIAARRLHVRVGGRVGVTGRVLPAEAGVLVHMQVRRPGRWATLDRTRSAATGRYRLRDRVGTAMSAPARIVAGAGSRRGVRRAGRLNVFRTAHASWYGPGLYGNPLGCGGRLRSGTLGVANKTLPCGTRVTLRHGGRTVRVPVVDRGPYVGGREYDLTAATARRLRFRGHGGLLVTR